MLLITRRLRDAAIAMLLFTALPHPASATLLSPTAIGPSYNLFAPAPSDTLASTRRTVLPNIYTLPGALQTWAGPNLAWVWNRKTDPSLDLASWQQVFNVARLGVYVIPLRNDPAERTNILLAAQSVDNVVIEPGATFSFNDTVGERTTLKGYQDGLMYDAGRIIRGTGGGICLVSTALYNAALQAGLSVLERHPHSGVVSYAPPGCDAAVVYGQEDMQFVNTTSRPLTVSSRIETDRIVISLYGAPFPDNEHVLVKTTHLTTFPAPTVTTQDSTLPPLTPPQVMQTPRSGYDVTVERLWTIGSRVLRREVVTTEHRSPRPKIVHVPMPADETPDTLTPMPQDAGFDTSAPAFTLDTPTP